MYYDFVPVYNAVAKPGAKLLLRGGAVHTRGDEDGQAHVRVVSAHLLQQQRHGDTAWNRPGMIAGDDKYMPLFARQIAQPL